MVTGRAGLLRYGALLLLAACDPCAAGTEDGTADALADVESCAPYGTTNSDQGGGHGECYAQAYSATYTSNIEEACGEEPE